MQRLDKTNVMVGTFRYLKLEMSPYSSPIMLTDRKNKTSKESSQTLGFINSRLQWLNLAFPLIRHVFTILGCLKCECLSVSDLKDA